MAGAESDSESRLAAREKCNLDLLSSEEEYVNMLEALVKFIYNPLRENAVRVSVKESRVDSVFVFIQHMLEFHVNFLNVIREPISILPSFAKYAPFVQIYDDYLKKYDKIVDVLASWRSMEFREFIRHKLNQQEVKEALITAGSEPPTIDTLPWFLYRPLDRVKEYYRFLKDLKRLSKHDDSDLEILDSTLGRFRPIYLNVKKVEQKLQQKTQLLEMQLRIHVTRACQMRRKMIGKKYKEITIYVFSDLFLWVSHRNKYKGAYSLYDNELDIGVPSVRDEDAVISIGKITEKTKRIIVFPSVAQRDKVLKKIREVFEECQSRLGRATEEQQEAIRRRRERDTRLAPEFSESSRMSASATTDISVSYSDPYEPTKVPGSRRETHHLTAEGSGIHYAEQSLSGSSQDMTLDIKTDDSKLAETDKYSTAGGGRSGGSGKRKKKKKDDTKDRYIAQLEAENAKLTADLSIKDDQIRTLRKQAETTRDTLSLKKAELVRLQAQYEELKRRVEQPHPRSASYDFRRSKSGKIAIPSRISQPGISEDLPIAGEHRTSSKETRPERVLSAA